MMSGLGQNLQFLQPQNITNIIPCLYRWNKLKVGKSTEQTFDLFCTFFI